MGLEEIKEKLITGDYTVPLETMLRWLDEACEETK